MPDSHPLVFTVILNWNGIDDTRECLESLQRATYHNNRIILVDNGSEGGEAAALRAEFGGFVDLIRNERTWASPAAPTSASDTRWNRAPTTSCC